MSEEEIGNKTRKFRDIALNSGLIDTNQEFDEWLTARDLHVADMERECIIALLKTECEGMRSSRAPSDWEQSYGLDIAIALIKGENE